LLTNSLLAQTRISGTISDNQNIGLNNVNVVLVEKNKNFVIAYSISNAMGKYALSITPNNVDSFDIQVSYIGYLNITKRIANTNQILDFTLSAKKIELPPVVVESKSIILKKGDTLTYNVSAFVSKTDRAISEVIRKLPGIEITDNGQIKYNGKPISNYYIDGLDLLESKYNIANQNLPADMVEKVQVLENHQPIKALDSSTFSDKAALNIKLKDNAKNKFITTVKLCVGTMPLLWENELLSFNFRKNVQLITGYKTNNKGVSLSNELADLIINQYDKLNALTKKEDILSIPKVEDPPFEEKRFLFNTSHLLYTNGLFVLNKSSQLKFNLNYLNNRIDANTRATTFYYFGADTVKIVENQKHQITNSCFLSNFNLTINKDKFFLKDNLKVENYWSNEKGEIANSNSIIQSLKNPLYQVINNFHLISAKGSSKVEFNSNTIVKKMPQELSVTPGVFADFFNQSMPYTNLLQNANLKTLATENYFEKKIHLLGFNQNLKLGIGYQNSMIKSFIQKNDNGTDLLLSDTFRNNLNWRELKSYAELGMFATKKGFQFDFTTKLLNTTVNRKDNIHSINSTDDFLFLTPSLIVKKDVSAFTTLTLNLSINNMLNAVNQNTLGYIATTYRNLSRNNFVLQQNRQYNTSFYLSYRNPLKNLFGYFTIGYLITGKNQLDTVSYSNQLEVKSTLEQKNHQNNLLSLFNVTKYIRDSKTSLSVGGNFTNSSYEQIQQYNLVTITNSAFTINIGINNRKSKFLYPEYKGAITTFISHLKAGVSSSTLPPIVQIKQSFKLDFYITKQIIVSSSASFYHYNSNGFSKSNYLFLDGGIIYKRKSYNVELKCNNLTNIQTFKTFSITENIFSLNELMTRPINTILQVSFTL